MCLQRVWPLNVNSRSQIIWHFVASARISCWNDVSQAGVARVYTHDVRVLIGEGRQHEKTKRQQAEKLLSSIHGYQFLNEARRPAGLPLRVCTNKRRSHEWDTVTADNLHIDFVMYAVAQLSSNNTNEETQDTATDGHVWRINDVSGTGTLYTAVADTCYHEVCSFSKNSELVLN